MDEHELFAHARACAVCESSEKEVFLYCPEITEKLAKGTAEWDKRQDEWEQQFNAFQGRQNEIRDQIDAHALLNGKLRKVLENVYLPLDKDAHLAEATLAILPTQAEKRIEAMEHFIDRVVQDMKDQKTGSILLSMDSQTRLIAYDKIRKGEA